MSVETRELRRMKAPDVAEYVERTDVPTALVPIGTTEQHGPHLCLGTDVMIPEEICRRIAPDVDALVAPGVPYGLSDSHRGFPGVAYLEEDTLVDLLADVAYSLCESGFDDVIFINGHNTNEASLKVACNTVMRDLPADKYVYGFPYWQALDPDDKSEYLSFEKGWHANVGETAAVMAIDETLADLEAAVEEYPGVSLDVPNPGALLGLIFFGPSTMYRLSESGVWGDPGKATVELGEHYYDMITEAVTVLVNTFQDERENLYKRDRPADSSLF